MTTQEFFHDFRQELMAGAEASSRFQLTEFMVKITDETDRNGVHRGF